MLTSFLLLLSTLFMPTEPADTSKSAGWKKIVVKEYTVEYPESWAVDTSGASGMDFILSSPLTDEEDYYNDFVNIAVMPMYGLGKTLDSYVEEVIRDIPFFYSKAVITTNKKETKAGKPCYVLTYAGILNTFPIAMHQYIWFENEKTYTLTYTAEQGSIEKWFKDAERIMDSVQFKK
jgi:hypothetical protein